MLNNSIDNKYESTMICPVCGRTGILKCRENIDIEFESDEIDPSGAAISYNYIRLNNCIVCKSCDTYMIHCSNEDELLLVRTIIDLGFDIETFCNGHIYNKTISINVDTGMYETNTTYVHPVLTLRIPIDDRERCLRIVEKTKHILDGDNEIRYKFYAEYEDCCDDNYYIDLEDIIYSLSTGNIGFDYLELRLYCDGTCGGVVDNIKTKAFDGFVKHCLGLINSFKELNT